MENKPKRRIIVIDDEPLISTLMKEVIEEDQELEISDIVTKKEEFLRLAQQKRFDLALIDISVGGREAGMDLIKTLQEKGIKIPAIMLSAHDEIDYALKCLLIGARGYVNKNYICSDLIKGLKTVLGGDLFVSGDRGSYILNEFSRLKGASKP